MTPHTFFIRNLTKINFFNLRKPKIDFKSFREVEITSQIASQQELNTNFSIYMVCVSQKTQPWHCASKNEISPVKINWCVDIVKIEILVIRIILGWFRSKKSTKNLTFSCSKWKSLSCLCNLPPSSSRVRSSLFKNVWKCWILKKMFGWKTYLGMRFLKIFTWKWIFCSYEL